jgi:hypothetical protein
MMEHTLCEPSAWRITRPVPPHSIVAYATSMGRLSKPCSGPGQRGSWEELLVLRRSRTPWPSLAACSVQTARRIITTCREEYNGERSHGALEADTMGMCGAIPPSLSRKEGIRSSYMKTGHTLLGLTPDRLDALVWFVY